MLIDLTAKKRKYVASLKRKTKMLIQSLKTEKFLSKYHFFKNKFYSIDL